MCETNSRHNRTHNATYLWHICEMWQTISISYLCPRRISGNLHMNTNIGRIYTIIISIIFTLYLSAYKQLYQPCPEIGNYRGFRTTQRLFQSIQTNKQTNKQTNERTNERRNEQTNKRTNEQTTNNNKTLNPKSLQIEPIHMHLQCVFYTLYYPEPRVHRPSACQRHMCV